MAVTTSELMQADKRTLAEGIQKMTQRMKNIRATAKAKAEQTLEMAVAGGAAFGVGYWMGTIARDNPGDADALTFGGGIDKDLGVGLALAGIGLTGMGGRRMSDTARAAGTGVLSGWAMNYGREKGMEAK